MTLQRIDARATNNGNLLPSAVPTTYNGHDESGAPVKYSLASRVARTPLPVPFASSTVDNALYSHFPVIAGTADVLGVIYHYGPNHTENDAAAVCLSQKPSAGGTQNLTINGNNSSGGSVSVLGATQVQITSDADDTARTFTVTGTLAGAPVVRSGAGPNTDTLNLTGLIDTITQVSVDGNTTGNITVGLYRIPCNISYKYSLNGGQSWSSRVDLGDGITAGLKRFYYPAIGALADGSLIAVYNEITIATGARKAVQRISQDGRTFQAQTDMVISGVSAPPTWQFYGEIKRTPSGKLILGAYNGDNNYVLVSSDNGANWVASLQVNSSSPAYSEMSFAIIDELNWICVLRIDGTVASLRQYKTTNGGSSWTDQTGTNLPASGGYQSHQLTTVDVNGVRYIVFTYMCRTVVSTPPPNVDTICMRFVKASAALSAATNWSDEVVLLSSLAGRSGYPTVWVNPDTGTALMAYGKETADRASQVLTTSLDIVARIEAMQKSGGYFDPAAWTPVLTCATPGDLVATLSTAVGRVTKVGKLRMVNFEVVTSTFTRTSASGAVRITGLTETAGALTIGGSAEWSGVTKANYTQMIPRLGASGNIIQFRACGSGQAAADLAITDLPSGGSVRLIGTLIYTVA